MCGITGLLYFNRNPVSPEILKHMTKSIAHRGPDGEGFFVEGNVGLGHRRLSIIDLSPAGHQPMETMDGRYVLTYNGEIYNFRELKLELQAMGYQFRSQTDSEVVLYAFHAWREKCFLKFNGMFALGIWDKQEKKLFLARDRHGVKPLYYTKQGPFFAFASEQKALLQIPDFKREMDKEALVEYFTFQNIFTDKTLMRDVHILPPGTYASLDMFKEYSSLEMNQYWDYSFENLNKFADEAEYGEELDRLFKQAVSRQLVTDVEIGSYLSGGMDSGSITAIAAKSFPWLKTFTCGFDLSSASGIELAFDERSKAEAMSYAFKTEHYEMVLKAGDMERAMSDLAWHLEEPRVGQSYPNYYAAKLASKFVKVVLSGVGGDELFAGYPWRYYRAINCQNFNDYIDKYYAYWQRLVDDSCRTKLLSPLGPSISDVSTKEIFKYVFRNNNQTPKTNEDFINQSLYFEAKTFLHGLLVVEDKLSMAHSLECRVPFLDNDLVDFAMKCPVKYKLAKMDEIIFINENEPGDKQAIYYQKSKDGKQILRNVMNRYIPKSVTEAVKQGFSAPDASWFKGESIEFVKRELLSNNARIYDYLDRDTVKNLVNSHLSGSENKRLLIWSLLSFETYLKKLL